MDTVAPARTSRPLWIALAVLFVANLALWYMLPARRVVHLDGTPDLLAGGSAVRTALTVMLGAFIPAAIVAGVLALIPIGPRTFNERYPWALAGTLIAIYLFVTYAGIRAMVIG